MEMVNPWMIYVGAAVFLLLAVIPFGHRKKYDKGKKVANTQLIKESKYYKGLMVRYHVLRILLLGAILVSILFCALMAARPVEREVVSTEIHNRDIMLCMDISDSMDEVNLEICDELIDLVKNLQGERFGISIFNGKSVLLVPLTTDYDYVVQILEQLNKCFDQNIRITNNTINYNNLDYMTYWYKYEGTICDWGSSFIGDGLATALFSFNDLKEDPDRTRIMIFTTDNELNGTPIVTVSEATGLCAKYNVPVYAVVPDDVTDEASFKADILSTGGDYYRASDRNTISDLADVIRATDANDIIEERTVVTDQPQVFFLGMLIAIGASFVLAKLIRE